MTIAEAIREADRLKPNGFPTETKILWLERLDKRILREILTHYEGELPEEPAYNTEDLSKTLLVPAPYEEMYIHWLACQMDYYEREYDAFNASNAMFEAVYGRFRNEYNRSHLAIGAKKSYLS